MKCVVCICTCDRADMLEHLLVTLRGMEFGSIDPAQVEIIIVDNHPSGQARMLCQRLEPSLPVPLHFVEEPERGISFARNRAVQEALRRDADFVAFIDDDDTPSPDWLFRLCEQQQETGADIVFGVWQHPPDGGTPEWLRGIRLFRGVRLHDRSVYGLPPWAGTYNVLIARGLLGRLAASGPAFAPEFAGIGGGDTEFFVRAVRAGAQFAVAQQSVIFRVHDKSRLTVPGLLKRGFRLGSSTMHIARKHATPNQLRSMRNKAIRKLLVNVLQIPLALFSRRRLMDRIYRISNKLGYLHGYFGLTYGYY